MDEQAEITQLLERAREGGDDALDRLFEVVYQRLRAIAHHWRERWSLADTLNITALVHEAYLKLVGQETIHWRDLSHFFAGASTKRWILTNEPTAWKVRCLGTMPRRPRSARRYTAVLWAKSD